MKKLISIKKKTGKIINVGSKYQKIENSDDDEDED